MMEWIDSGKTLPVHGTDCLVVGEFWERPEVLVYVHNKNREWCGFRTNDGFIYAKDGVFWMLSPSIPNNLFIKAKKLSIQKESL